MLNVAIKAARAAGAIINRAALDVESVRISQKQINDFVTEVDHAAEKIIIETLLTAYPGHGILAEESGQEYGAKHSDFVWVIDPLDGTTNFIHGFPVYCVSIALAVKGKIEHAVIYDPTRNDLFHATKGRGAFMNDRRIRVSKRIHMEECLISTVSLIIAFEPPTMFAFDNIFAFASAIIAFFESPPIPKTYIACASP